MAILPKAIYKFKANPIKISISFFFFLAERERLILKFMWKYKGSQIFKKNSAGQLTCLHFKTYYTTTCIGFCCLKKGLRARRPMV